MVKVKKYKESQKTKREDYIIWVNHTRSVLVDPIEVLYAGHIRMSTLLAIWNGKGNIQDQLAHPRLTRPCSTTCLITTNIRMLTLIFTWYPALQ